MKRFIYATIALAAIAIGCTKSNIVDVPEGTETPISFDIYNGKTPVTKAIEVTKDVLMDCNNSSNPAFHVRALNSASELYMNHDVWYAITTEDDPDTDANEEEGYWDYRGTMYWPINSPLTFFAYSPLSEQVLTFTSNSHATYTAAEYASDQKDLIVSEVVKNATAADGTVDLEFHHVLSRIGFQLETVGTGTNVVIHNIILHGTFANQGTINFLGDATTDPAITAGSSTTDSYTFFKSGQIFSTKNATATPVDGEDNVNRYTITATEGDNYMMIIPGQVRNLPDTDDTDEDQDLEELIISPYIEVQYHLGDCVTNESNDDIITAKLPLLNDGQNWNFAARTAYEFIFRVSISAIEFEGEVVGWDDTTYFPEQEEEEEE